MNTGHDGSICTVHANGPRDVAVPRRDHGADGRRRPADPRHPRAGRRRRRPHRPPGPLQGRLAAGSPHVTEVVGMEGDVITLQDIFVFDHQMGVDEHGRTLGTLKSTGLRPKFLDKLDALRRPARPGHLRLRAVRQMTASGPLHGRPRAGDRGRRDDRQAGSRLRAGGVLPGLHRPHRHGAGRGDPAGTGPRRSCDGGCRSTPWAAARSRLETRIEQHGVLGNTAIARSAVELAERVTKRQGLSDVIDGRLEAAGIPMRTPEWLVVQLMAAVGLSLLFLLFRRGPRWPPPSACCSRTGPAMAPAHGAAGTAREARSSAQLPDTLQMLAGCSQAGSRCPRRSTPSSGRAADPMSVGVQPRAGREPPGDARWRTPSRGSRRADRQPGLRLGRDGDADPARRRRQPRRAARRRSPTPCASVSGCAGRSRVLSAEGRLSACVLGALPRPLLLYLLLGESDIPFAAVEHAARDRDAGPRRRPARGRHLLDDPRRQGGGLT